MATVTAWCDTIKVAVMRNGKRTALIDYSEPGRVTLATFENGERYQGVISSGSVDDALDLARMYCEQR